MNVVRAKAHIYMLVVSLALSGLCFFGENRAVAADGEFEGYDIRVIRPKFMSKRGRFELGGQLTTVMNQVFIYTYLATGIIDYHFTETLALEVAGAYGFSIDKEDKRILEDEFQIQTQILRTEYLLNGALLWTPVYGKYQLSSGEVIYFDTFLTVGGGLTGIRYLYEQCGADNVAQGQAAPEKPAPATFSYPGLTFGIGQKFFMSRSWALRWDARDQLFFYNEGDGSCTPEAGGETKPHQNITLQLGASTFF
jgi:outer membrane beta-barrel protein